MYVYFLLASLHTHVVFITVNSLLVKMRCACRCVYVCAGMCVCVCVRVHTFCSKMNFLLKFTSYLLCICIQYTCALVDVSAPKGQ